MEFANPTLVKCPRCNAEAPHQVSNLLALGAICPTCRLKLDHVGKRMRAQIDEASTFVACIDILMAVEDSLGTQSPPIPDESWDEKPVSELTLRDLVRAVHENVPLGRDSETAATRLVLKAAEKVAAHHVSASELDRPLSQALRLRTWAEKHGLTNG
jgi:hypothetical protein